MYPGIKSEIKDVDDWKWLIKIWGRIIGNEKKMSRRRIWGIGLDV